MVAWDQQLNDPGLESLSEVLNPRALAGHLRGVCLGDSNAGAVEEVRVIRVLKHHLGSRCTLEIGWRGDGGWHSFVAKVYSEDRPDVLQAMERIQAAGFGPQEAYSIPRPLAYLPSLRLFLQEKVEGPLAKEIFNAGDARSRAAAAERCARWLGRYHAFGPKAGPVFKLEEFLDVLRKRTRKIVKLKGRCGPKAERLLQWLEESAGTLQPVELCAGHGSFSPAQLILAEGRTVTVDWDGCDVADPARDVARFLYALRRWALDKLESVRALDEAAEVFWNTYRTSGPALVHTNLLYYNVASCLKLARTVPHWQEQSEIMLDEGLGLLGQDFGI